ncbi:LAFA_0A06788g1_1 [Lachancea sp. 'fantastica']|nr:LAFA_0A06788g1_1 [Lachancea sp. 'fantastica']
METTIRELEDHHVRVHRELLEVLDELYLARKGLKAHDRSAMVQRRELQCSMATTSPIAEAMTNNGKLEARLLDLMQQNYEKDGSVVRHQDEKLRLISRFTEERIKYGKLLQRIRPIAEEVRSWTADEIDPRKEAVVDEGERYLEKENETLRELLVGIIMQSGYQGTNKTVDNWLEFLEEIG